MKKKVALLGAALLGISMLSGCNSYSTKLPDYSEYVTLGNYSNLEYIPMDTTVTDEDVDAELDYFVEELATEEPITDRGAEIGDNINIDYVGSVDGVEFDGGNTQGEGTDIVLGESGYIDNFDEQLEGMKPGETKDVIVTFPDPYENNPDLAGKEAVFKTTLNTITQTVYPELTDDLVAANSECKTVDEFRAQKRTELEEDAKASAEEDKLAQLISAAAANATFNKYPEDELKTLIDDTISDMKSTASMYNLDYATYILYFYGAETEADFEAYLAESAEVYIQEKMTVCEIAKKEKIQVTDKEIEEYANQLVAEYDELEKVEDVYEYYTEADIEYMILTERVGELLAKTAVEGTTEATEEEEMQFLDENGNPIEDDAEEDTEEAADDTTEADTEAEDTTAAE